MTLNDYRVAPGVMFMKRSDPQLTLGKRSLKLNGVCRDKLGKGRYVEFLYHPILEVIAVRSAYATNPNAVLWDETKSSVLQLCSSAFSGAIFDKLDWMKKYKFRFRGVTRIRDGERIIFFFLDEPQILVGKAAKQMHICEVCGRKEILTPQEAFDQGWDYPPMMGHFGVLSPRTCPNCNMMDTVWAAITMLGKRAEDLTDEQQQVIVRIVSEPDSILVHDE